MNLNQFKESIKNKDWFFDLGEDQFGRYVVYTKYMCNETLYNIPDKIDNKQVLVHLASYLLANKNSFIEILDKNLKESQENELEGSDLSFKLNYLESKCGENILQDLFFEIHDGKNSVTNLSSKYPEVKEELSKLYFEYGFDVIYEELGC